MDTITPANASPSLRVLLIEDSADDAQLVSVALFDQGYSPSVTRVATLRSLEDALGQGPWDVVLCDDWLRGMDAFLALTLVQARGLDLPFIVIVSSRTNEESAIELMRAGAHDFLYKHGLGRLGAVVERETCAAETREERRRLQQQLLRADRLSSIGMLATGVAHEINNPLAYVLGNLEFALGRLAAADLPEGSVLDEVAGALEHARDGSERIGRIARDLKVFCGGKANAAQGPVNVRRVMESSINIAWNHIRHRARLTRRFERVPIVKGDETRLGQVFLNLLVNAAQALPSSDDAEQNEIVVALRNEGERVVIEVQDTGNGMSPEELAQAFEPFFTTKPSGVGSGIGLSICRSIVADMGGEISCESRRGFGSTFRVSLPALEAVVHSTLPPPNELPEAPVGRILVIDDEPALCAVVRRLLRGAQEVVGSLDAREALNLLDRDPSFDVVLCDVMMPRMSGVEFFEELSRRHPALTSRLVFMTGGAFHAQDRDFLRKVQTPLLEKPFETRALREAVARVLEGAAVSGTWRRADLTRAV